MTDAELLYPHAALWGSVVRESRYYCAIAQMVYERYDYCVRSKWRFPVLAYSFTTLEQEEAKVARLLLVASNKATPVSQLCNR